jgi:hypothetical protein
MIGESRRPRTGESEAAKDERVQANPTPPALDDKNAADPGLPEGMTTLAAALAELVRLLPGLKAALERTAGPAVAPLAYRKREAAAMLGISPRLFERLIASRRGPRPTAYAGRCPLFTKQSLERWISEGGSKA